MKNYLFFILRSKLILNIKGNNIERFIKRLKNNNIELLNIKKIYENEVNIKIYKKDYESVLSLKTIYEINILDCSGIARFKKNILDNKYIITFILFSFILLYFITQMTFDIKIITNDSNMKESLIYDLNKFGIKKYSFKKNYNDIQKIKKELLDIYKNEIEWIEIETIGTSYIVRYEPRVLNKKEIKNPYRSIIARKDAVITDMSISKGQIVKGIKSYVKKGDVIVSGYITLNDNIINTESSEGVVYGETWYKVEINYPYKYYEVKETGKKKNVFAIKFLNNTIELLNFNKYKTKKVNNKIIFKNSLLPIFLINQHQKETKIINEINTYESLKEKAILLSKKTISRNLKKGEYIKGYKILNEIKNDKSVTFTIFFYVIENITYYQEIPEYNTIENDS